MKKKPINLRTQWKNEVHFRHVLRSLTTEKALLANYPSTRRPNKKAIEAIRNHPLKFTYAQANSLCALATLIEDGELDKERFVCWLVGEENPTN